MMNYQKLKFYIHVLTYILQEMLCESYKKDPAPTSTQMFEMTNLTLNSYFQV
jgi:hypothetical protein